MQIVPLTVTPANIERGSDIASMIRKADLVRAVSLAPVIDQKPNQSANELASIGKAELIAGRYDDARRHLRAALSLEPFRTTYAMVAWDLSQLEYMCDNFEASLDWAHVATEHGVVVRPWHMDYLTSLAHVDTYKLTGPKSTWVPMHVGHPDVPRVDLKVNGGKTVSAIIDSGAVLSIVSQKLAASIPVRSLGDYHGNFSGLLGEPIEVRFGLLESLQIGEMTLSNVPVAIMPDEKMKFLVAGKKEFRIDFLLGANLLKEFRTDIDFRRNVVTFTHLTGADRHPAVDQNLYIDGFRPVVRGAVNRHGWFLFVLDTGSEVTFLNEKLIDSLPIQVLAPKMHNSMLQGLGGTQKHGPKVENVEIGLDRWGGIFHDLPMYDSIEADKTTGIIGENFLHNFVVTIDFGRMKVELNPIGVWMNRATPDNTIQQPTTIPTTAAQ